MRGQNEQTYSVRSNGWITFSSGNNVENIKLDLIFAMCIFISFAAGLRAIADGQSKTLFVWSPERASKTLRPSGWGFTLSTNREAGLGQSVIFRSSQENRCAEGSAVRAQVARHLIGSASPKRDSPNDRRPY